MQTQIAMELLRIRDGRRLISDSTPFRQIRLHFDSEIFNVWEAKFHPSVIFGFDFLI